MKPAELRVPIYLDAGVQSYLAERAADKGVPPGERAIQIIESVK